MAAEGGLLPPVIAELRATTGEFKTKMLEARGEMSATAGHAQGTFDKMAGVGKAAFEGLAVAAVALGTVALHEADKFEASHARMETALHNVGIEYDQVKGKVDAYDRNMEKLGFTNADAENSLSRLVVATKDLGKATTDEALAADIARARHMDLQSATDLLVKVEQGRFTMLTRLGIASKEQVAQLHNAHEATQLLTQLYGGQAQAFTETFAGKMEVLKAKSEDLAKNIGLELIPIIEKLVSGGLAAAQWLERHHAAAAALAVVIGGPLAAAMAAYIAQQAIAFGETVANNVSMLILRVQMLGNAVTGAGTAAGAFGAGLGVLAIAGGVIAAIAAPLAAVALWGNKAEESEKHWADSFVTQATRSNDAAKSIADERNRLQAIMKAHSVEAQGFYDGEWAKAQGRLEQLNAEWKKHGDAVRAAEEQKKQAAFETGQSIDAAYAATGGAASQLGGQEETLAQKFKDAQDAAKALKEGLDLLIGVHVSAERAAISYQDKIAALITGLRENKNQLDINTEAGRKDQGAILDVIDAITSQAQALREEGHSAAEVNSILQNHVGELQDIFEEMGLTKGQVAALIAQYHLIPSEISTSLDIDTSGAQAHLGGLLGMITNFVTTASVQFAAFAKIESAFKGLHLAGGGFVDHPQIAMIGERGRELVLPLTDHRRTIELLAQAGLLGMPGSATGGSSVPVAGGAMHVTFGDIVVQGVSDPKATALMVRDELAHLVYSVPTLFTRVTG